MLKSAYWGILLANSSSNNKSNLPIYFPTVGLSRSEIFVSLRQFSNSEKASFWVKWYEWFKMFLIYSV